MSKCATLLLITVLAASSLIMISSAFAQSPTPSVPEFTLAYVDNSYDVPPKTTTTTNPYNNETTTTTTPGYHVENKTIEVTINNIGASYYNFRYKGRYTDKWNYYPFDPNASLPYFLSDSYSVPYKASNSTYTVAALPPYFFKDIPERGEVDVQVQALFGDFRAEPFGHIFLTEPTYDFYFEGTASGWSSTQTITIGEIQSPTPSPTNYKAAQPTEQEIILWAVIVTAVIGAGLGLLIYLIKRK